MKKQPYKLTQAQELLRTHIQELGIAVEAEVTFHPERKWRFDLFLPEPRIGIEIDGGMWSGGHRHMAAIELDHEKSNVAQMMGIRVLRFTNRQVLTGQAVQFFKEQL